MNSFLSTYFSTFHFFFSRALREGLRQGRGWYRDGGDQLRKNVEDRRRPR